jgi:hypothetical protein
VTHRRATDIGEDVFAGERSSARRDAMYFRSVASNCFSNSSDAIAGAP